MAFAYYNQGKSKEAIKTLLEIEDYKNSKFNIAKLYQLNKEYNNALLWYEKAYKVGDLSAKEEIEKFKNR